MGILNVTPDSFSERGAYFDRRAAIARGLEIEREGADILDVGGESTRPGAMPVDENEEMDRVLPVIEILRRKGLGIPISIDTYKANVAERALQAGAEIVNDVSGLRYDAAVASVVANHGAGLVLMHLRGTPLTMQRLPAVQHIIPTIRRGIAVSLRRALRAGVGKRQIVIDPGIGFGKSYDQNFEILRSLSGLSSVGYPILVGPSRKSFLRAAIAAIANHKESFSDQLLMGNAAAVTTAILNGAHIVRVHDVREMVAVVRVADRLLGLRRHYAT